MSQYNEPSNEPSENAPNITRALNSLNEEIEHACMTLEWLRRYMPGWDASPKNETIDSKRAEK